MAQVFKRIVLLSPVGEEKPVFRIEKEGARWEYRLSFGEKYDSFIVFDGQIGRSLVEKDGFVDINADGGLAVAVVLDNRIISYGTSGTDVTKARIEKLFLNAYDDEAIATENYYGKYYEQKNENADVEDGGEKGKAGKESDGGALEDDARGYSFKKQDKDGRRTQTVDRADGACQTERKYAEQVASNIAALFYAGKIYPPLSRVIPLSRWVEISDGDKTYYFGLQGESDYICYAVKGVRGDPPEGFGEAFFLPESFIFKTNDGYYMTFQSAKTGESIYKKAR